MVGIVVVSHSASLAEGVAELARELGGPSVTITPVGGGPDGGLGTDGDRVLAALHSTDSGDGVILAGDLGSGILTARLALERLEAEDDPPQARLVDAPLVEGVVAAAVIASAGASLEDVAAAAEEAWNARKL